MQEYDGGPVRSAPLRTGVKDVVTRFAMAVAYVPLPRRFYGMMLEAFRAEKGEWQHSTDITVKYVKSAHDFIYFVGPSAISALTAWARVSAASHISPQSGRLWADLLAWRSQQVIPPMEPPPPPSGGGPTLPGQLPLFGDSV
jgi:hypothetical protein